VADLRRPNAILDTVFNVAVVVAFDDEIAGGSLGPRQRGGGGASSSGGRALEPGHRDALDPRADPIRAAPRGPAGRAVVPRLPAPLAGGQTVLRSLLHHWIVPATAVCTRVVGGVLHVLLLLERVKGVMLEKVPHSLGGLRAAAHGRWDADGGGGGLCVAQPQAGVRE